MHHDVPRNDTFPKLFPNGRLLMEVRGVNEEAAARGRAT